MVKDPKNPPKELITDNDDGSKTCHFSDAPVMSDGVALKSIVMREPRVSDQLAVDNISSSAKSEVMLIANLCDVSPETIEGMTMRQYGRVQDAYQAFMS